MARAGVDDRQARAASGLPSASLEWPLGAAGAWTPMLAMLQLWNGSLGTSIAAFQMEWLDFVNQRVKEEIKLPQSLAGCKSTDEFQKALSEFYQKAARDYRVEVSKFVRLSTSSASQNVPAAQQNLEMSGHEARSRSDAK